MEYPQLAEHIYAHEKVILLNDECCIVVQSLFENVGEILHNQNHHYRIYSRQSISKYFHVINKEYLDAHRKVALLSKAVEKEYLDVLE